MKKLIVMFVFILISSMIHSQIFFDLDFSISKFDECDELVNLDLVDYNQDMQDEICVTYINTSNEMGKFICYNQSNDVLIYREYPNTTSSIFKSAFLREVNDEYLFIVCNQINSNDSVFINIELYDFLQNTLIDEQTIHIGTNVNGYMDVSYWINSIANCEFYSYNDEIYLFIGYIRRYHSEEFNGVYTTTYSNRKSYLNILTYNNGALDTVGEQIYSGNKIIPSFINGRFISLSLFESSYDSYDSSGGTNTYYIHSIDLDNLENIEVVDIISGNSSYFVGMPSYDYRPSSIRFLSIMDNMQSQYGTMIYYYAYNDDLNFVNYSPDLNSSSVNNFTYLQLNRWDEIEAAVVIPVNNEDNYLIYFDGNKFEIRNRITLSVVYIQYAVSPTVEPIMIKKMSNDTLYFISTCNEMDYYFYYLPDEINIQLETNENEIPMKKSILQNYPNPFNPSTTIEFSIQNNSTVELVMFNIKGQKIKILAHNEFVKGDHSIIWNGDDESGKSISSGIYYYKLNVNGKAEAVKKCLLLK